MSTTLSVSSRDIRRLLDITRAGHEVSGTDPFPASVLEAIRTLIPCDQVTYQVIDPYAGRWIVVQDLVPEPDDLPFPAEFFWRAYWSSMVCSYPQVTGDRWTVTRSADLIPDLEFDRSLIGEVFRLQGSHHCVLMPLAAAGSVDYRIELWRPRGGGFDDHELLLLELLHPHLVRFERQARLRGSPEQLTQRQTELLALVAEGLTNRQIGRQLGIVEGTVRRHLENVYARIGVSSRAAATTYYLSSSVSLTPSNQTATPPGDTTLTIRRRNRVPPSS